MSDLTATQCGCGQSENGCNSFVWIIILLFLCGGCGNGSSGLFGFGNNGSCNGDNGCEWIIWLLLLSCCCGGNGGFC